MLTTEAFVTTHNQAEVHKSSNSLSMIEKLGGGRNDVPQG